MISIRFMLSSLFFAAAWTYLFESESSVTRPEYLSERTKKLGEGRARGLLHLMQISSYGLPFRRDAVTRGTIQYLPGLIELVEMPQQRQQR